MEHQSSSQLLFSFVLLYVLCCQAVALPPLGTYSAMRLGNRVSFDGANEPDHVQGSLKTEADIIDRNTRHADGLFTSGYSKLLGQLSAKKYLESLIGKRVGNTPLDEQMPVKRHSDAVFTDMYSRLRKQMAMKKYLDSVLTGKRSQEELKAAREEPEFLDPAFSQNYDDVTVDELELLNHLPANL